MRYHDLKLGKRSRCRECQKRLEKGDRAYRNDYYKTYCLKCGEPYYLKSIFQDSNNLKHSRRIYDR